VIARATGVDFLTVYPGAFSPDGGALVFEDGERLRVLDVATGKSRVLAGDRDGRRLRAPAWSPKGDRIAAANDGGGIELLDPVLGYGPTVPASSVWTESIAWSPDGATLALQFARPNESGVKQRYGIALVAPAPDARLRRIVEPTPYLSPPVWSPDSTALAVSRRG
jgi:Tol biopolymer transport system component